MRIKLQTPSATALPPFNPLLPPSAISQIMLIANPSKVCYNQALVLCILWLPSFFLISIVHASSLDFFASRTCFDDNFETYHILKTVDVAEEEIYKDDGFSFLTLQRRKGCTFLQNRFHTVSEAEL